MDFRPFILATLPAVRLLAAEPTTEQSAFYVDKVLPIFAENCYRCHSAEGGKDKGGLTLDSRDGMLKGGDTGPAVVPGDAEKSLLIKAVGYKDTDLQMPPKGEKLSPAQVADLSAWVKMGAPVPANGKAILSKLSGLTDKARSHWAYQPVKKPQVPVNKNQQWCRTPVDCFILQKLEAATMFPSPDAPKEALIRRAYYDIVGLPPSPAEVDAFLTDTTPQAWAKVVDRLLAMPQYGERWGRHWLDTARYSDTAGSNVNGLDYRFPHAWAYRDWVVGALNADMPYDQFVMHQLAADLLPAEMQGKKQENLAALGFITIGERFGNVNDLINERIDTVSKGFLAMTVACARCHDHMFDPISQKDYYALHGVFSSITEPRVKPQVGELPPKAELDDFVKKEVEAMKNIRDTYFGALGRINQTFRLKSPLYLEALTQSRQVPPQPASTTPAKPLNANALRALSPFGQFIRNNKLDEEIVRAVERRANRREDSIFGPLARLGEITPESWNAKAPALLAEIQTGTLGRSKNKVNPIVVAVFKDAKPANIKDVWQLYDKVFAAAAPKSAIWLDEMAITSTGVVAGVDAALADVMQVPLEIKPGGAMTMNDYRAAVERIPNRLQGAIQQTLVAYNELLLTHPGAPAHAMVVSDQNQPRNSPVLIRGQADNKGELVPRRFLDILSPGGKAAPFTKGSGRLELAQDIASKSNPLTARVLVNRVWMHHFGEGFVPTPDDLGTMSEKPTHPELLDWLASYFMESGWSMKKLHRLILLSRAYQESTHVIAEYEEKDPYNKLLWRANVRRLDFESVRDSMLTFSGQLDKKIGGKPVNLTDEPYSFRRSVYGYVDRGNLPELMAHFDFSKPDMANSKRTSTVVPQQALFLMNSPMTVDVVRRIVNRPEFTSAPAESGKISALYRIIFQRMPTKEEYKMGREFLKAEAADAEANSYVYEGSIRRGGGRGGAMAAIKNDGLRVSRRPLSPWETYAQVLLLSNESAYVN
jgi:mono/diheme cytochrome c family protein